MPEKFYHPVPLCFDQDGNYETDSPDVPQWTYAYAVEAEGTKSERRTGMLTYGGKEIPPDPVDTGLLTPWGPMRANSSLYRRGWLPKGPHEKDGVSVPGFLLSLGGKWMAKVGGWKYEVEITKPESKSERREGTLFHDGKELKGDKDGETVNTPWGVCRWCSVSPYEQGWLFCRTYDRPW